MPNDPNNYLGNILGKASSIGPKVPRKVDRRAAMPNTTMLEELARIRTQARNISPVQRLLGSPISKSLAESWPELQQSWAGREIEMPDATDRVHKVMEAGPVFKMLQGLRMKLTGDNDEALGGAHHLFNTITLNRDAIDKHGYNLDDVLAHELAHIRQGRKGWLRLMRGDPTVEHEATNYEALRKARRKDVELPAPNPLDNILIPPIGK